VCLASYINDAVVRASNYGSVLDIVSDSIHILNQEYSESSGVMELRGEGGKFLIIGDLHGDLESLRYILSRVGYEELVDKLYVIFLGDYVDRGKYQLETLLSVLLIKLRFPDKVYLLRGNHEPPPYLTVYPHDFPLELRGRYGVVDGSKLYEKFMELFQVMPHALIVRNVALILHGGPPTQNIKRARSVEEYLIGSSEAERRQIIEEVLWNDPVEEEMYFTPSYRGAGYLFGPKITEMALGILGVKVIIRGHEPCINGYKLNHSNRVVTIFSRLGAPYYNRYAAYMLLNTSTNISLDEIANSIVRFKL